MEDALVTIVAGALTLLVTILQASMRPWKYFFSKKYRIKIKKELNGKSKLHKIVHIFSGFIVLALSLFVVVFAIWFFLYKPEPELGTIEKLENKAKDIFIEAIIKAKDNRE